MAREEFEMKFAVGMICALLAMMCFMFGVACARTDADSSRAETIASPMAGYTCFAIKNGEGLTVGGNCVKD
jgi:hypothetical protein